MEQSEEEVFIPDDILICFLTRLDIRDIIRCGCVCKRWKCVTSTPQFEDLVRMPISNLPMILVKNTTCSYSSPAQPKYTCKEFCIDKWWGITRTLIHKEIGSIDSGFDKPCSQNGFILTRIRIEGVRYEYIICNPMTSEQVKIVLNDEPVKMLGIYLHPTRKEYCTIWQHDIWNKTSYVGNQYKLLNLGAETNQPLWRNIDSPWKHWWRSDSNAVYCLNDGFMYWCVHDAGRLHVMAFDINTEVLTKMPPPTPIICNNHHYFVIEYHPSSLVVNGDGYVSLVHVNDSDKVLLIWTLKGRFWTASQCVYYDNHCGITNFNGLKPIAIVNSELLITGMIEEFDKSKQLFVCDLQSGTIRKLEEENKEYPLNTMFCAHYPTIASLRSLPRVIYTPMNPSSNTQVRHG